MYKYNLFLYLLTPYLILKVIFNAIRRKSGITFILQRLGLMRPKLNRETIWIHASSIGETKIALSLYSKLILTYPKALFFITTTTSSSKSLIIESEKLKHYYLPLDWQITIKKFITLIKPRICIIVETEIWPNLINICKNNKIPITIINGRLSNKTLQTNKLIKNLIHKYEKGTYKVNFKITGFDKFPHISLIIEAKKKINFNLTKKNNINYSKLNYNRYGVSLMENKIFSKKTNLLLKVSRKLDNKDFEKKLRNIL